MNVTGEELRVGDVVKIRYNDTIQCKTFNTILITNINNKKIYAVWFGDEEFRGKYYQISNNQIIYEIIKRGETSE